MLEAEYAGCRICYRRVKYPIDGEWQGHLVVRPTRIRWTGSYRKSKMVNELVINGYVYAEMEMLMEPSHMLSAVVNGHLIQVGFETLGSYSYINVDGNQIARKIRWY